MVATMDNNSLVRELFEPKDDSVAVKSPSDWSALVRKILSELSLNSLRMFSGPEEMQFGTLELEDGGHMYMECSDYRHCEGLSKTSHLLACGIIATGNTTRTKQVLRLVMNRKGEFFTAKSVWIVRKDPDDGYRDYKLKYVTFTPITIDSLCSKFTERVGEVVITTLCRVVAFTEREVKRQLNDLERQYDMICGVARRIGVSTR